MAALTWLERYSGQSTDELISLEPICRLESIILAFEEALDQKAFRDGEGALSYEERVIVAIEALEREVNNGGYRQFFINSSAEYLPIVIDALLRIQCPATAALTRRAVETLGLTELGREAVQNRIQVQDAKRDSALNEIDSLYYKSSEHIAARLFAFIKDNRSKITLP
ncbi:MAG TPA: DUF4375 domain-containing protein [Candidatus Sulfotelmatobacter sp.]|nr:DUF4375 domain-containing protein [Candidatus Sulfotelmatobacter sp.]